MNYLLANGRGGFAASWHPGMGWFEWGPAAPAAAPPSAQWLSPPPRVRRLSRLLLLLLLLLRLRLRRHARLLLLPALALAVAPVPVAIAVAPVLLTAIRLRSDDVKHSLVRLADCLPRRAATTTTTATAAVWIASPRTLVSR